MLGDHPAASCQIVHGLAQQRGVGDGVAVVREDPHPGIPQLIEMGELLSLSPHRDRSCGDHVYLPDALSPIGHEAGEMAGIGGRIGIGHGDHGGIAAGGRSSRSRSNVLFPFLARLAQVGVQVDESWSDPGAVALDQRCGVEARSDLDDHALGDANVSVDHAVLGQDAPTGENQLTHRAHLPSGGTRPPFGPPPRSTPAAR